MTFPFNTVLTKPITIMSFNEDEAMKFEVGREITVLERHKVLTELYRLKIGNMEIWRSSDHFVFKFQPRSHRLTKIFR